MIDICCNHYYHPCVHVPEEGLNLKAWAEALAWEAIHRNYPKSLEYSEEYGGTSDIEYYDIFCEVFDRLMNSPSLPGYVETLSAKYERYLAEERRLYLERYGNRRIVDGELPF